MAAGPISWMDGTARSSLPAGFCIMELGSDNRLCQVRLNQGPLHQENFQETRTMGRWPVYHMGCLRMLTLQAPILSSNLGSLAKDEQAMPLTRRQPPVSPRTHSRASMQMAAKGHNRSYCTSRATRWDLMLRFILISPNSVMEFIEIGGLQLQRGVLASLDTSMPSKHRLTCIAPAAY